MTGEESASPGPRAARSASAPWSTACAWLATTELDHRRWRDRGGGAGLAVVDSVQTMALGGPDRPGRAASGRCARCATRLAEVAKAGRTCVALVGHVTKEGDGRRAADARAPGRRGHLPGGRAPRLHAAAARGQEPLRLDRRGRRAGDARRRASSRWPTPSRFFLESEQPPVAGSAVTIALEGTRPLAVEIQALVAPAGSGSPRRATTGIDVEPGPDADRGAAPATPALNLHRPRRLRQRRRRPARSRSRPPTWRWRWRSPPASANARCAAERCWRASSPCRDGCAPASRAERRLAEARRLGFDRLITGPSRGTDGDGPNGPETAVDVRSALLSALARGLIAAVAPGRHRC